MLKTELIRYLKNPFNILFSFALPVLILLTYGFTNVQAINSQLGSIIFLNTISITVVPFSILIFSDKADKRIKQYLIIDKAFLKYLGSLILINFIIYVLNTILVILIGVFAFKANLNVESWLMIVFLAPMLFIFGVMVGVILASFATSIGMVTSLGMIVLFLLILQSGVFYPFHFALPNSFFYIEVWTLWGQVVMLFNYVSFGSMVVMQTWQVVVTAIFFVASAIGLVVLFLYALRNFRK